MLRPTPRKASDDLDEQLPRVPPDDFHDTEKLEQIDPSLAALVVRYERLRLAKLSGEIRLRELGALAGSGKATTDDLIVPGWDPHRSRSRP
jgi:hypothetical protein